MLSSRQRRIISHMLQNKGFTSIREFSNLFHVSERSIQYDLENIEYYAKNHGAQVKRDKRSGVQLISSSAFEQQVAGDHGNEMTIYLSPEERKEKILITLFESLKPVSSGQLASLLFVSRRTIVEDLKEVHIWLSEHDLELDYMQNKGFHIKGEEQRYRESYVEVLIKHYQGGVVPSGIQILTSSEIALINRSIDSVLEKEPHYSIVQTARDGLVFHIAITVHRVRNECNITMPEEELQKLAKEKEFAIAERIQQEVEEQFSLKFPESETGYITLHLLGAKQADLEMADEFKKEESLTDSLEVFIRHMSGYMGIDLTTDSTLLNGLLVHLKPALYRLRFHMRNENPLKQEIQERYPNTIAAVNSNLSLMENAFNVTFNDDETAYIAMHIGSAIERKLEKTRYEFRVLLVCASGVGTSQLLKSKIENYYPELKVYDSFSVYDIDPNYFTANRIDLIITTIPTPEFPVPVIKVSPFLTKGDREKLNGFLNAERENAIESGLSNGPALNELLPESCIRWNEQAANWEEAVRKSVEPLVMNGIVTQEYEQAIIEQFKINGPYMVIDHGVALPHAKPSHGVKHPGFSFVKLRHPVYFGHSQYDPVKFVICLATVDPHIHLNALRQLTMILQDHEKMEQLREGNKHGLMELLKDVSRF
ncbi:hypothetical protein GCM10007063_17790 [Lentibacillus kapialis]|uniref:PTS system EIIA component n=1 Tax=Lentibacillus kapialis TaxID=340214 RepID=A0A917UYB5_9BACI|nr:BglG family transcription antiterminator [Lentibacillus kapialis]GGJ95786.1 hypothetical protein GCM10007063_17790 [Lentibacillus kapialis]